MLLWILIGYMWLFIHRPFEVWPVLGTLRIERVYAIGAILAVLASDRKRWLPNGQHFAYFSFAGAVLFCWLASPWMDQTEELVENYFKVLVFYLLIVSVVNDERALRMMVLALLGCMTIYLLHSLREYLGGRHTYRMGIARMIGVDSSLGDPNSFGAGILYVLPFVVPFWMTRPSKWMRIFLVGYIGLSGLCILLTGSRSSFIGLVLWGSLMILRSRWRWAMIIGVVVLAPVVWGALPPSLQNRFETIIDPSVGPENARISGESRWEGLTLGMELFSRNPSSGCGPGAWKQATRRNLESHNLYGQLMGELGLPGVVTFLAIIIAFVANYLAIQRLYKQHPEWGKDFLYYLSRAIMLAVFLLLFEGNFGHNLFRFSWLWYGGFLIITHHCLRERLKRAPARAYSPLRVMRLRPAFAHAGVARR